MKFNRTFTQLVILFGTGTALNAAQIALSDASFETVFGGSGGTPESGWFTFGSAVAAVQVDGGFWNIGNPDGTNAVYATSFSTTDGGSIYQSVTLDAGRTYRFTAAVAQSATVNKNDANYALVFFTNGFTSLEAVTTGIVANQSGSFVDDSVEFTATTTGIYNVGVRNRGHISGTGADNDESTVFFDNARLVDITPIPEPSSTALIGLGGLALLMRRKK